jgi:DNA replication protein DnaC
MELRQHLSPKLKALRLSGILDTLDVRTRQATDEQWTYAQFLERLLEDEIERRQQKQLALRVRRATLNAGKTLETFDFNAAPGLNRQLIYELAAGHYLAEKRNILLCGPTGTGKSHLAQALAHEACRRGFDVVFRPPTSSCVPCTPAAPMTATTGGWRATRGRTCWCWTTSGCAR